MKIRDGTSLKKSEIEQTWNYGKVFESNTIQFCPDHLRDIWNLGTERKPSSLDANKIKIRL